MSVIPVNFPKIPFLGEIPGGLNEGTTLWIKGIINKNDSFWKNLTNTVNQIITINIQCGPSVNPRDHVALHLSIRPGLDHCIVRNTLVSQMWGPEERHGGMPIEVGKPFEIGIKAEKSQFYITVNSAPFCVFTYRLSPDMAKFLEISGEVVINSIGLHSPAPQTPQTPVIAPVYANPISHVPHMNPTMAPTMAPMMAQTMAPTMTPTHYASQPSYPSNVQCTPINVPLPPIHQLSISSPTNPPSQPTNPIINPISHSASAAPPPYSSLDSTSPFPVQSSDSAVHHHHHHHYHGNPTSTNRGCGRGRGGHHSSQPRSKPQTHNKQIVNVKIVQLPSGATRGSTSRPSTGVGHNQNLGQNYRGMGFHHTIDKALFAPRPPRPASGQSPVSVKIVQKQQPQGGQNQGQQQNRGQNPQGRGGKCQGPKEKSGHHEKKPLQKKDPKQETPKPKKTNMGNETKDKAKNQKSTKQNSKP